MKTKKIIMEPKARATTKPKHDAKLFVVCSASRRPWKWGKRKPVTDDCGNKWCNCKEPKLISGDGRGQAFCLLCMTPWYH